MFFFQFGNFDHLRINDGDMNLIQYLSLDVAFFWCCLLVAVIYGLRSVDDRISLSLSLSPDLFPSLRLSLSKFSFSKL